MAEDEHGGKPPEEDESYEPPEEKQDDGSPLDDVEPPDLDRLGPDTDTELEAEFKEELAGGPPTREYTQDEAAEAQGGGDDEPEPEHGEKDEWEPPSEESVREPTAEHPEADAQADAEHDEEPGEPEPVSEETEIRHPETGEEEQAEEPGDEEPESEEHEHEEHAPEEELVAAAPLAPTGPTPAQGTMPPGMKPPPGFTPQPDSPDERPPRPHLLTRFFLAAFIVVATFAGATSVTILNYFSDIASGLGHDAKLQGVDKELEGVNGGKPQTILIIGSDRRYGEADRGRSDTTILMRLDPNRDAISLFSIPRDLKVNIPGYGTNKFNAAYAFGGPKLTLKVVKQLTGLNVNHLVNVDFAGFFYAINAIDCVYVDVDHRYLHSNAGLSAAAQYAEINIQPGYQKLCGEDALAYVRYRHLDNDLVRSARQHDFLREARQKVDPQKLISDRKKLLRIFTRYTSSDIDDWQTMLKVMKLFLAARGAPIKEVHFPAQLGGSYVTATPAAIHTAVDHFLGITGTTNPRGNLNAPLAEAKKPSTGKQSKKKKKKKEQGPSGLIFSGQAGKDQGLYVKHRVKFPVFYPTQIKEGSIFAQDPYTYSLVDAPGQPHFTQSYKMVLRSGLGEYYGLQGTKWPDPPILRNPSETRNIRGRTYNLYFDNDRLRLVSWHYGNGTYWVSNTLLQSLTEREMLGIATTMGLYKPRGSK